MYFNTKTARTSLPSKGGRFKVKYAHIVEARWREHRVCQWAVQIGVAKRKWRCCLP
jgi:hypothetical protein